MKARKSEKIEPVPFKAMLKGAFFDKDYFLPGVWVGIAAGNQRTEREIDRHWFNREEGTSTAFSKYHQISVESSIKYHQNMCAVPVMLNHVFFQRDLDCQETGKLEKKWIENANDDNGPDAAWYAKSRTARSVRDSFLKKGYVIPGGFVVAADHFKWKNSENHDIHSLFVYFRLANNEKGRELLKRIRSSGQDGMHSLSTGQRILNVGGVLENLWKSHNAIAPPTIEMFEISVVDIGKRRLSFILAEMDFDESKFHTEVSVSVKNSDCDTSSLVTETGVWYTPQTNFMSKVYKLAGEQRLLIRSTPVTYKKTHNNFCDLLQPLIKEVINKTTTGTVTHSNKLAPMSDCKEDSVVAASSSMASATFGAEMPTDAPAKSAARSSQLAPVPMESEDSPTDDMSLFKEIHTRGLNDILSQDKFAQVCNSQDTPTDIITSEQAFRIIRRLTRNLIDSERTVLTLQQNESTLRKSESEFKKEAEKYKSLYEPYGKQEQVMVQNAAAEINDSGLPSYMVQCLVNECTDANRINDLARIANVLKRERVDFSSSGEDAMAAGASRETPVTALPVVQPYGEPPVVTRRPEGQNPLKRRRVERSAVDDIGFLASATRGLQ